MKSSMAGEEEVQSSGRLFAVGGLYREPDCIALCNQAVPWLNEAGFGGKEGHQAKVFTDSPWRLYCTYCICCALDG